MSQRHPPFWWLPLPPAAVQQNGGSCHLAGWARWALCPGRSRFVPSRAATASRAGAEHQRGPVHRHNVPRPDWLRELHRLGEIGVACRYRSALSTLLRATQPTIVQQGKERLPSNLNCTPQLVGRGDTRCKAQWH